MSILPASIGHRKSTLAFITVLLMCSGFAFGQSPQVKSGAIIYIEPADGYETDLAAAFMKEKVPVVIVTQKGQADYILTSGTAHSEPNTPAVVINNSVSATASVEVKGTERPGNSSTADAFNRGFSSGEAGRARRAAAKAALGTSDATVSIMDAKSTRIVFAYSGEKNGSNQLTKTAEECAKHLKAFIKKSEN